MICPGGLHLSNAGLRTRGGLRSTALSQEYVLSDRYFYSILFYEFISCNFEDEGQNKMMVGAARSKLRRAFTDYGEALDPGHEEFKRQL